MVESGELLQWAWQAAEGAGKRMRSKMSGTIARRVLLQPTDLFWNPVPYLWTRLSDNLQIDFYEPNTRQQTTLREQLAGLLLWQVLVMLGC